MAVPYCEDERQPVNPQSAHLGAVTHSAWARVFSTIDQLAHAVGVVLVVDGECLIGQSSGVLSQEVGEVGGDLLSLSTAQAPSMSLPCKDAGGIDE